MEQSSSILPAPLYPAQLLPTHMREVPALLDLRHTHEATKLEFQGAISDR